MKSKIPKIAYLGPSGSYHHQALIKYFLKYNNKNKNKDPVTDQITNGIFDNVSCNSFEAIVNAVANNQAQYGVIATENKIVGTIEEVQKLLNNQNIKNEIKIIDEVILPIDHNLIGLKTNDLECKLSNITTIYSHPKALQQCSIFLRNNPNIKTIETSSTTQAVSIIKQVGNPQLAVIASSQLAQKPLMIIQSDIADKRDNWTKFTIFGNKKTLNK